MRSPAETVPAELPGRRPPERLGRRPPHGRHGPAPSCGRRLIAACAPPVGAAGRLELDCDITAAPVVVVDARGQLTTASPVCTG